MLQPAFHSPEKTNVAFLHQDTQYRKIFVGGLPYHTTDESLRDYFLVFGEIEEAVVITDRQTGKSKGYGFVSAELCSFFDDLLFSDYCLLAQLRRFIDVIGLQLVQSLIHVYHSCFIRIFGDHVCLFTSTKLSCARGSA